MAMGLFQKRSDTSAPQTSAPSQTYSRPFVVPTQTQEEAVQASPEPGVSLLNNRYQVSATPNYQSGWIARAQAASQPRSLGIQAKLTIGQPNDKYEQEADRVAEQVMGMPDGKVEGAGASGEDEAGLQAKPMVSKIQREVLPKEEDEELQMKPIAEMTTPIVQREAIPEDNEELQLKSIVQREEFSGEDKELQMKPIVETIMPIVQRDVEPIEDELVQAKCADCEQDGKNLLQRKLDNIFPSSIEHRLTPSIQRDPTNKMPPLKGSTIINQKAATLTTSGKTITEAITNLISQGKGEAGSVTCAPEWYRNKFQADGSPDEIICEVNIVVTETKAMPVWTELAQQCEPVKREWNRFYRALDTHENGHLTRDQAAFKDLHKKILGRKEEDAVAIYEGAITKAETDNEAYDLSTGHGFTQGTRVNPIECELKKVSQNQEDFEGEPLSQGTSNPDARIQPKPVISLLQRDTRVSQIQPQLEQLDLESRLSASKGGGSPLPSDVRSFMEPRFGANFSEVRVHTGGEAVQMNREVGAQAFAHGRDVYFGAEKGPGKDALTAHELTHVVQQTNEKKEESVQRKGGKTNSSTPENSASTGQVGISGGESQTPSDQMDLAKGYTKHERDEQYNTPDGRVITKEQAIVESQVINSKGIFMGAYLARFNALKKYFGVDLNKLSSQAGFMHQFKTGDVVLRMMKAADSEGLAKVTNSQYSHSGIIQVNEGRVWVLDSYPGRGGKKCKEGGEEDSTKLTPFEDFFGDQHGEEITQGIVLRVKGVTDEVRYRINELINKYNIEKTSFDIQFRVDNGDNVLYCSELVWRILKEAGSSTLPANEFEFTKKTAIEIIGSLKAVIAMQKVQGNDTSATEKQLGMLEGFLSQANSATNQELYSPGSLERSPGLETLTGFTREGKIEGSFKVIVVSATIPPDKSDTPDGYVAHSNSKTSVKNNTTTPAWNEMLVTERYDLLNAITLQLYDEDVLFDDLLATFKGDLRPVHPEGQTFVLNDSGATLTVKVEAEENSPPQAPRRNQ
jgi:hypothetical protein